MPQWKRLTLGVLFAILAVTVLFTPDPGWCPAFVAPALYMLLRWYFNYKRDRNIVLRAAEEYIAAGPQQQLLPPAEASAINDLFVPEPLNR